MRSTFKSPHPFRSRSSWAVPIAVGLAAALAMSACGTSSSKASQASSRTGTGSAGHAIGSIKPSGTIQIGLSSAMDTLSPLPFGAKNYEVYNDLYSSPVTVMNGSPSPALASSWTFGPNDLSLTLNLRPNLTFSDGTPINASTVLWNISWEEEPANASHSLALWKEVTPTAVNSTTVKLTFAHPMPEIFGMLAGLPIVKPNAPDSGVSSGPFMVSQFVPGTSLTVVPNKHYWGTPPGAAKLTFTNYANTSTAALALRSGTINLWLLPAGSQIAVLKAAGDKILLAAPTNDGYLPSVLLSLLVNTSTPPLNDILVRQALSLAFNRTQFVATALSGFGSPADSVIAAQSPAYEPSPSTTSFDLAKAKTLLQQAGISHLTLSVDSVSILPQNTFMPVFQQDLAQIGVTLNIHQIDPATWATLAPSGNFPDLLTQENGFVDTDPAINFGNLDLTPVNNSEHFSTPQYTKMVQAAAEETNPTKRQDDYKAIGAYLQQQMFIIPVAYASTVEAAYSPNLSGVQTASFSGIDFPALRIG